VIRTTKRRWIFLAALLGALGAGPRLAAEVQVSVAVAEGRSADALFEVIIVAEPADVGATVAAEQAMEYVVEPGLWVLDLPEGRPWLVWAEAPGYSSNEVQVERDTPGQRVELWLWRAGILRGGLSTTAAGGLPMEVELRLEGDALSSDAGGPQSTIVKCPVVQEVWECEVPAGKLDLTLAAEGFASHHRRRVIVKPDQVRDLGTFQLDPPHDRASQLELETTQIPDLIRFDDHPRAMMRREPVSGENQIEPARRNLTLPDLFDHRALDDGGLRTAGVRGEGIPLETQLHLHRQTLVGGGRETTAQDPRAPEPKLHQLARRVSFDLYLAARVAGRFRPHQPAPALRQVECPPARLDQVLHRLFCGSCRVRIHWLGNDDDLEGCVGRAILRHGDRDLDAGGESWAGPKGTEQRRQEDPPSFRFADH